MKTFKVVAEHNGSRHERREGWIGVNAESEDDAIKCIQEKYGEEWPPGTRWTAEEI